MPEKTRDPKGDGSLVDESGETVVVVLDLCPTTL